MRRRRTRSEVWSYLVFGELAVAVFVESLERSGSVCDLIAVERTIRIRVDNGKERRNRMVRSIGFAVCGRRWLIRRRWQEIGQRKRSANLIKERLEHGGCVGDFPA